MASAFDNAIAAGLATRRRMAGQAVSYNDGTDTASVRAVKGRPDLDVAEELTVRLDSRYHDWMIKASDLADAGINVPPAVGHTITINSDVYTVVNLVDLPCWQWVDGGENEYRIHTLLTTDA